ncbi:hypothetical protein [Arcicella lustrica]|uniref:DUF3471 domain-containing protein n=1 Tax=Arcicella lustrica TaxID=2984196 RepID=A0ABU5SHU7_9BACT|nr:hypothetical protein [Arcicella sp. DC25W]MEA5426867.1 hypothetical protein [Arcicella sp. DC25W]
MSMKKCLLLGVMLSAFCFIAQAKTSEKEGLKLQVHESQVDSLDFKDYYGSYKMADNPYVQKMKVYFKAGELFGQASDYPETKLIRKKEDEFEESNFGAQIIFVRTDGLISGVKVIVQGQELIGTKE